MTGLAIILVLISAVAHSSWNLLLKRVKYPEVSVWSSQVVISVLFLPLAVVLAWQNPIVYPGWWFVLGTVLLHILYFVFLGRGYTHGDLSVVYPIARGMGPALVPFLGIVLLGESVHSIAIVGIAFVVVGIFTVFWWGKFLQFIRDPFKLFKDLGIRYAMLTGLVIAAYAIWDKQGVKYVSPFLYMYFLSLGTAVALFPYMLVNYGIKRISSESRINYRGIVVAGLLMFLAYGLILTALQFSRVSYVFPLREIGIVIGVLLGVIVLKEPYGIGRLVGSGCILCGLVLIVLAP